MRIREQMERNRREHRMRLKAWVWVGGGMVVLEGRTCTCDDGSCMFDMINLNIRFICICPMLCLLTCLFIINNPK